MAEGLPASWLKDYYKHFYPVKSVFKWLSYGKSKHGFSQCL